MALMKLQQWWKPQGSKIEGCMETNKEPVKLSKGIMQNITFGIGQTLAWAILA